MALNPYIRGEFKPNVSSCNYSAEINSRNPGDYSGATQQATFSVPLTSETYMDLWASGDLLDTTSGKSLLKGGQVTAISDSGTTASYTVSGLDSLLGRHGKINPINSTYISLVVRDYFNAAGVAIPVVAAYPDVIITTPAWEGDLWDGLKQVLAAYGYYIYFDEALPVVRSFSSTDAMTSMPANLSSKGRAVQAQDAVEWVEVAYYNTEYVTNRQVYPHTVEVPSVYSVGGDEVAIYEIQMNASLAYVNQPIAVNTINLSTIDTVGQYSVVDSGGAPVQAAEWLGQGGSVHVRLKDHQTLEMTIRGMKNSRGNAPYRIAEFGNVEHGALYVTGTGVRTNRQVVRLHTGASRSVPGSTNTIDNPFIATAAQAYTAGQWAASAVLASQTISYGGGPTAVAPGTKYNAHNGAFRVMGISQGSGSSSFSGIAEVSMKNFADTLGAKTMAQMAAIWSGKTMGQVAIEPLRTA